MSEEDRKNVIQFYKEEVFIGEGIKPHDLTIKDLKYLKNSLWFSKWMLSNKYDECVNSIKKLIKVER